MNRFYERMANAIQASRRLHEDADFMEQAEAAVRLSSRWSANALLYAVAAFLRFFAFGPLFCAG